MDRLIRMNITLYTSFRLTQKNECMRDCRERKTNGKIRQAKKWFTKCGTHDYTNGENKKEEEKKKNKTFKRTWCAWLEKHVFLQLLYLFHWKLWEITCSLLHCVFIYITHKINGLQNEEKKRRKKTFSFRSTEKLGKKFSVFVFSVLPCVPIIFHHTLRFYFIFYIREQQSTFSYTIRNFTIKTVITTLRAFFFTIHSYCVVRFRTKKMYSIQTSIICRALYWKHTNTQTKISFKTGLLHFELSFNVPNGKIEFSYFLRCFLLDRLVNGIIINNRNTDTHTHALT